MNQSHPLAKISNQELELRLKDLATKERKLLHIILEHIKELETRKLYLARAYSSAFEYLVKELGYSNSAAMRRLEAARLLRDVPVVAQKIQEGAINLSQIGELSRALKEKEKISGDKISSAVKADLVAVISGKTTQETQKELAVVLDIPIRENEKQKLQQDESLRLEITLSPAQIEKFQQCKDSVAHLLMQNYSSDTSWVALFEILADQFLAKRKKVVKSDHVSAQTNQVECSAGRDSNFITDAVIKKPIYKTMTPLLKRTVFKRDGSCQFTDPLTGKKCGSTFQLEVDHKTSQWAGGQHELGNLQTLCRQHNNYKYHLESGIRNL